MRYKTYKEHNEKWNRARQLVHDHNEKLIKEWRAMEKPWWDFWSPRPPSFEKQRSIILENWNRFRRLPTPRLADYYPIKI